MKNIGKAKEYNEDDELVFEGEYLDGKRWNGKGKDSIKYYNYYNCCLNKEKIEWKYSEGELIFEGEYLNGKRWNGNGKEYNYDGELIFEGEYLNGEKRSIK